MIRSEAYLDRIRHKPCIKCGKPAPNEAHHVRTLGNAGIGIKPSDFWTVPLCGMCHKGVEGNQGFLNMDVFDPYGKTVTVTQAEIFAVSMSQSMCEFLEFMMDELVKVEDILKLLKIPHVL